MTDCTYAVFTAVRFGLISVEIPIRGDLFIPGINSESTFDSTGRVLRTKDPFDFFVLVHGNIPKLTVILRGICFSYEYRFCLAGKCINYVFIEKIKCHKNRVGGTYSKHLPPLYSENIQFTSYLPQQPVQHQYITDIQ